MDITLAEQLGVDPHLRGPASDEGVGGGGRFLHHVADLAGQGDVAAAGEAGEKQGRN